MKLRIICLLLITLFCKEEKISNPPITENKNEQRRIVFFGDSLTAGMGLSHPDESFPSLIFAKLKTEGFQLKMIHAGLSGDTTSGGLSRLDWVLSRGVDYFILELGANDGMRGIKTELIEENLKEIIRITRKKNPKVKILLVKMLAFPNFGPVYVKKFNQVFEKVSKDEKVDLSPFLLEKVAGIKKLNQKDGIHPTEEGHKILAENLYPSVKKILTD